MRPSKHLALTFLLGAALVGGALGFTADRVMVRDRLCPKWGDQRAMRLRFGDELELTPPQRAAVDSILDARQQGLNVLLAPVRPQMDSIKVTARERIQRLLTPAQRARFDEMQRESDAFTRQGGRK